MPQLEALLEGWTHREYYLAALADERPPEDYQDVPYPHPYIELWLECKRHANSYGIPALPEPAKGPLDQDADVMLAFEVLEEAYEKRQDEEEARERNRAAAQEMGFTLGGDPS